MAWLFARTNFWRAWSVRRNTVYNETPYSLEQGFTRKEFYNLGMKPASNHRFYIAKQIIENSSQELGVSLKKLLERRSDTYLHSIRNLIVQRLRAKKITWAIIGKLFGRNYSTMITSYEPPSLEPIDPLHTRKMNLIKCKECGRAAGILCYCK